MERDAGLINIAIFAALFALSLLFIICLLWLTSLRIKKSRGVIVDTEMIAIINP